MRKKALRYASAAGLSSLTVQDEAARVEVEHGGQVGYLALFVAQPVG
jgi:hypothetical protein